MGQREKVGKNGSVRGQVKWFDTAKGFGFIVAEDCKSDILLHANVLRSFGRNSIAGNSSIEVVVQETDRGCQATEIINIEAPLAALADNVLNDVLGFEVMIDPKQALQPARVKWFDRGKGFGFVNIFGQAEDIFIHMEVLQACGLSELQPGEAICIKTADGPRGRMVWNVQVWDHAVAEQV